ncbi:uncharacterized protein FPRO_02306 [Fusarium proliferatum ET1]|uniref:Uncharacterized protein n=1 Tax=Fusarium proliferatum (strain ET1) TaxID=1227346 RepID=A0A1L7VB27_FUSPR|nr:uncharacterized protein FPRO_02306 [Fusarium proliferatum ET1]CZR37434.1 uncharacterized protein FPRO_02306 [Fusarium proliferatum ET1]
MQPFYDREEDEYLLRIENSPRWDWGRDANGQVWYWEVSGTAGHATATWRFKHNGEFAYGHEPLDFWDDWYDESGDKAKSTPYGRNLHAFIASDRLGSEIPQRSAFLTFYVSSQYESRVSRCVRHAVGYVTHHEYDCQSDPRSNRTDARSRQQDKNIE